MVEPVLMDMVHYSIVTAHQSTQVLSVLILSVLMTTVLMEERVPYQDHNMSVVVHLDTVEQDVKKI